MTWLSEDATKNGQSRDTGHIGHKTQNDDKQKQKYTTHKSKKMRTTPPEETRIHQGARED